MKQRILCLGFVLWSLIALSEDFTSSVLLKRGGNGAMKNYEECVVLKKQDDFKIELEKVGWYSKEPEVDWGKFVAVVIAPKPPKGDYEMKFHHLRLDQAKLKLTWQFVPLPSTNTGSSASFGSSVPEVLIVLVPVEVYSKAPLTCIELAR